ncbi:hypothetical protein Vretimale_108, partial [Volvox reticuliferus]
MNRAFRRFRNLLYAFEQQHRSSLNYYLGEMLSRYTVLQYRQFCGIRPGPTPALKHARPCQNIFQLPCSFSALSASTSSNPGCELAAQMSRKALPLVGNAATSSSDIAGINTSDGAVSPMQTGLDSLKFDAATDTLELWYDLLRLLHEQGDFKDKETPRDLLIQQQDDVKDAIVNFARRRADILFNLPPLGVAAVAEAELLPRDLPDRKLRNADRRLKETYVTGRVAAGNGQFHATMQDLLRVLRDWAVVPPTTVETAAPALAPALRHLLSCIRHLASLEPDPAAMERAQRLGTPTAAELAERLAVQPPAEDRRKAKVTAFLERRHRLRVRDALGRGAVLEAGDWFCSNCGSANWKDRPRCFRCAAPSNKAGNSVVTPQDIAEVYGDRPPRRRPRAAMAAADADALYDAQAAVAAEAASAASVASGATAGVHGGAMSRVPGGAHMARNRKAPLQLVSDEEDEEGDSRGRGAGRRQLAEAEVLRGRPGLRRRAGPADGDDDDEVDLDDEQGGPYAAEARSSPVYQRTMREYYRNGDEEEGSSSTRGWRRGGSSSSTRSHGRGNSRSPESDQDYDGVRERPRGGRDSRFTQQESKGLLRAPPPPSNGDLGDLDFEEWEASEAGRHRRGSGGGRGSRRHSDDADVDIDDDDDGDGLALEEGSFRRGTGRGSNSSSGRTGTRSTASGSGRRGERLNWLDEEAEAGGARDKRFEPSRDFEPREGRRGRLERR